MKHQRYLLWLLLFGCLTLLPAVVLNLVLLNNTGNIEQMSFAASEWQEKTHGITFTPTFGFNGIFKTLRLNDRLPEIDTVLFSSSTAMPVDSAMLPPQWRLYNFAQSGSSLGNSVAQAEYLVAHAPQVKHYIIALDWSLDFIYQPPAPGHADLSRPKRNATANVAGPTFTATLREAVSYAQMQKLGRILTSIAKSPQPQKAFREYFLQVGSDEYLCPDGKSPGKDFGIYNRGSCNGFRYDGSATYSDYNRVGDAANRLTVSALSSTSKYAHALQHTQGVPNAAMFARLAELDRAIAAKGGTLLLFMPPLLPGLEEAFLRHPQFSAYLLRTKQELKAWAANRSATLADFGQSERYGCTTDEFLDEHHATQSCYQKIFAAFWQNDGKALLAPRTTSR